MLKALHTALVVDNYGLNNQCSISTHPVCNTCIIIDRDTLNNQFLLNLSKNSVNNLHTYVRNAEPLLEKLSFTNSVVFLEFVNLYSTTSLA